MAVKVVKDGDWDVIIEDQKSFSGSETIEFKTKALELISSGTKKIALDFSQVEYIDSSGIGKILFLNKKLQGAGEEFKIQKINSKLYSFLESLAINKVLNIADPS